MVTTALGHTAESVAGSWKSANHFLRASASFLLLCFVSPPLTKLIHKIPSPRQRRLDSVFPSHWFIHLPRLRPSPSEYIRGTTVPKTRLQPLCHVRRVLDRTLRLPRSCPTKMPAGQVLGTTLDHHSLAGSMALCTPFSSSRNECRTRLLQVRGPRHLKIEIAATRSASHRLRVFSYQSILAV